MLQWLEVALYLYFILYTLYYKCDAAVARGRTTVYFILYTLYYKGDAAMARGRTTVSCVVRHAAGSAQRERPGRTFLNQVALYAVLYKGPRLPEPALYFNILTPLRPRLFEPAL